MVQKLGIEEDKVVELNQLLYRKYGTSMAGLKVVYLHKYFVDQSKKLHILDDCIIHMIFDDDCIIH